LISNTGWKFQFMGERRGGNCTYLC
jgi:hypothetical protein